MAVQGLLHPLHLLREAKLMDEILPNLQTMYGTIDRTVEGEVVMAKVVEYIRAVEAGMGKNEYVNKRLVELLEESEGRQVEHVEFGEFVLIIEDIVEAGWSVRKPSQNEKISNMDILHVFQKVDRDNNNLIDRQVGRWQVGRGGVGCSQRKRC